MFRKRKFWIRLIIFAVFLPVLLFSIAIAVVYWKQDAIVQHLIETLNEDFEGQIEIKNSHISPFKSFPLLCIDLDEVKVFEDKSRSGTPLLDVHDVYICFDLWTIISGKFEIKSIRLRDGFVNLVQHKDGSFNIANALSSRKEIESAQEEFHLDIHSIHLADIDFTKLNEENDIKIETYIHHASAKFRSVSDHSMISLNSKFLLNVIAGGDTTFIRHKHFDVHTRLDFDKSTHLLTINPSEVKLEHALFKMDGTIDTDDDMNMDVNFHGTKSNFDLLMAFAPEELEPVLKRYDNGGKIYFDAHIKGKSVNGYNPLIIADFGCEEAFFNNTQSHKKLEDLYFKGHFTTGDSGKASTMEFSLEDFSAKPEAGIFRGNLHVKNFEVPEIEMQLTSEFDLDFIAKFMNITDLKNLKGRVALTMNFHDIVDLSNPERSIEKLNESYYTELEVSNLSFRSSKLHLAIDDIDIKARMDGHKAKIDKFDVKVGNSDLSIKGEVSDLPAVLHHTNIPVTTTIFVTSSLLDLHQLTSNNPDKNAPIDEQIRNLSAKFVFKSSAKDVTESATLPRGEFFVEDFYGKLNHYPHTFHDFHADIIIRDKDIKIIDFTGMVDKSDFHFTGKLVDYDLWFQKKPQGDTRIEFNLRSALLQLEDLFSYGGENYVPEEYRHEEFRELKAHGFVDLHFREGLQSTDANIDLLEARMKIHPMKFERFKGRVHIEDDHIVAQKVSGKIGKSDFSFDLNYYLGKDKVVRKRDNHLTLRSTQLDFDELFKYNPPPGQVQPKDHEDVFNIYDLPFTDMTFDLDIGHLKYHRYLIDNFHLSARTQENHYIYIDTLKLAAAGGNFYLKGYFNGSDRNRIYFSPDLKIAKVDLDKLMFKFENFGQDHLVSENLHGKFSGRITGKIHMHADMVPIVDDSEIHIDVEVLNGRLEKFKPMETLSDFFKDKNLGKILFDTLSNHIDLTKGLLSIPRMTINSSLGFIEISGRHELNGSMDYYVRVPWKLVTDVAVFKLFGNKNRDEIDPDREDAIVYRNESKKVRFLNLRITGTPENYKIGLGKDKQK